MMKIIQGTPSSGQEAVSLLPTLCEVKISRDKISRVKPSDFLSCFNPRIIFMISVALNKEIKTIINPKIVITVVNTNRNIISLLSENIVYKALKRLKCIFSDKLK